MKNLLKFGLVLAAATGLAGTNANAAACVSGSVATYEASGFSCQVGELIFSNFNVNTVVSGGGVVALGNFNPFTLGNENGLTLNYTAAAVGGSAIADIDWTYTVQAAPGFSISDAFAQLTGSAFGTGSVVLSETLTNSSTLAQVATISLSGPGSQVITFDPVTGLFVSKDQEDFSGPDGSSFSSVMTNAFSVPGPTLGAGLPGLIAACAGLFALARRRRQQTA